MTTAPKLQELSIVLAVPNHNPTLLTPDFLAGSGIIPTDWQLARSPVLGTRSSQVSFTSGVNVMAQVGSVTFSEGIGVKAVEELNIAAIASQYARTLPNLDYQAVGINPKHFMTFEQQPDGARQYISALLAPGAWHQIGKTSAQATLTLIYPGDKRQLRLSITEARLQAPEQEPIPTVLFAGNFNYPLSGETAARLESLDQAIGHWQADLELFQKLIATKFPAQPSAPTSSETPEIAS